MNKGNITIRPYKTYLTITLFNIIVFCFFSIKNWMFGILILGINVNYFYSFLFTECASIDLLDCRQFHPDSSCASLERAKHCGFVTECIDTVWKTQSRIQVCFYLRF